MTYVIEPSMFGIGFSIFRLEVKNGKCYKHYIADVASVAEGEALCTGAISIVYPKEDSKSSQGVKVA